MTLGLPENIREWVERETGAAVVGASAIGQGASRRIWAVDLDRGCPLVVREDTGTGPVAGTPLDLAREAAVYRALSASGLPVPALHGVSPDGAALLLTRAVGTEDLRRSSPDDRGAVIADYAQCLARLHDLDVGALQLGPLAPSDPAASATLADIALWRSIHEIRSGHWASAPVPVALSWLADHVPDAAGSRSLCHGDAGPGNFLHADGRVTAMLDWEFAHVGDPHDDLAWVAVRNQVLRHPIELSIAYRTWRDASGEDIDGGLLEYFRALVLTRMLISCDASLSAVAGDERAAQVQAALRPYLAVALLEALRRAGCPPDLGADLEPPARETWAGSLVAGVLGDPSDLDDLGAAL